MALTYLSQVCSKISPARRTVSRILCRQTRLQSGLLRPERSHVRPDIQSPYIRISDEIKAAVESLQPVVALESAIYTHGKLGFPYPDNIALASHLESLVRTNGGIPATTGILNGIARVGFEPEELIGLAESAGQPETKKISRRDLSYICGLGAIGRKLNGGTTVSGTMLLSSLAGIRVFATGGLGGVHRGAESSFDISADLTELGRTNVAVFSSGCKSFLDLPRTLEYLETQGVFVGTFADGRIGEVDFPAFWTRDSGTKSPITIAEEAEAAALIGAMTEIPVHSGLLFANPIPKEHSIEKSEMDAIIAQAVQDAEKSRSIGSANTPFVLNRIREISNGRSVAANRALIEANVVRATRVAVLRHDLMLEADQKSRNERRGNVVSPSVVLEHQRGKSIPSSTTSIQREDWKGCVIVAGSVAIDLSCDYMSPGGSTPPTQPQFHTSNPSSMRQTVGGVGHNVASAIHHLGAKVLLCSRIANDVAGSTILASLKERGFSTDGICIASDGARTAQYTAINDADRNLVLAMADMEIMDTRLDDLDPSWQHHLDICKPRWLVVDANWHTSTLQKWIHAGKASGAKVALEPVSVIKSRKIFEGSSVIKTIPGIFPYNTISLATPNVMELGAMYQAASSAGLFEQEDWFNVIDSFQLSASTSGSKLVSVTSQVLVDQGVPQQNIQLLPFIPCILTTLGKEGVLMTELLGPEDHRLFSPDTARYILSRSIKEKSLVGGIYMRLFPISENVTSREVVSVNGIGDSFLGVIIAGLAKENPKQLSELIGIAQKASVLTLKSAEAVSPAIEMLKIAI